MVLAANKTDMDESMPQIVPSAGFTPPCDYSAFADNFDLSLLPGGDLQFSPSASLYTHSPPPPTKQPKIYSTFYNNNNQQIEKNNELETNIQNLFVLEAKKQDSNYNCGVYLDIPSQSPNSNSIGSLSPYSTIYYPNSPESFYTQSPGSVYSKSPNEEYFNKSIKKEISYPNSPIQQNYSPYHIKEETYLPTVLTSSPRPSSNYSSCSSPQQIESNDVLELFCTNSQPKQIKQESTVDFGNLLQNFDTTNNLKNIFDYKAPKKVEDHQLLREVLRDTSFQKKHNIKPIDISLLSGDIKMEEPEENGTGELINSCTDLPREKIEPVLNLAIEQVRKDVRNTCTTLGISPDPSQWNKSNVLAWLQWTSQEFGLSSQVPEQWDVNGNQLITLTEEEFRRRSPQGGVILHAKLEIWKAAYSENDFCMQWLPENNTSNNNTATTTTAAATATATNGEISDEDDEETTTVGDSVKPTTSSKTGGSHIHLWQFLKELLASPQIHGSCIRWIDRTKGVFKIEDSVKVARLWGKRKNRPAMNYDKLSRSIRQYYKKGIMKKTERSQRLVYQFCHPYCL